MSETSLAIASDVKQELSTTDVIQQVSLIQQIMSSVMREGEHYGCIPGCGPKPSLLKPGAEKLGLTFRLAPTYEVTRTDLGHHREYEIKCVLTHIPTGVIVGEGLGSCSTMEKKYRYRSEVVRSEVPKEYWDSRDANILGGPGYRPRKQQGKWVIVQQVENEDVADYYNTCLKIGKKRAFVDAMLTATAASDIFTQDVEDMRDLIAAGNGESNPETVPEQTPEYGESDDFEIKIGKHKNALLTSIVEADPGWVQWVADNYEAKDTYGKELVRRCKEYAKNWPREKQQRKQAAPQPQEADPFG